VPGSIQSDLEAAHLLKPLWYGAGDPHLDNVARKDWWYRLDFRLSQEWEGKRVRLVFEGVDFECDVWLNGQRLGAHAGQSSRFGFDVSHVLRQRQLNRLAVRVGRAPEEIVRDLGASSRAKSAFGTRDWFLFGYVRMRERLKDRRSATSFGWDWAPNLFNLGIWRDVRLEVTGPARIDWVQIQTPLSNDYRKATLKVRLDVHSQSTLNARAIFSIRGHGTSEQVTAARLLVIGRNETHAELTLDKPRLWWPSGHGSQPLYDLETRLEDTQSGVMLDSRTTRFGVREIRWGQVEGAPENFINPYRLIVNGRTVRMMGCGMLATDVLYGAVAERCGQLRG
jgi:beta-mannosidase